MIRAMGFSLRRWSVVSSLLLLSCGPAVDAGGATSEADSSSSSGSATTNVTVSASSPSTVTVTATAGDGPGPMTTNADSSGPATVTSTGPATTDAPATSSSSDGATTDTPGTSTTGGGTDECGDGMVGRTEQCDGADLQGFDCDALGLANGVLACDPTTCTFDTSGCAAGNGSCGDGAVDPGEQCDGANLQGFDCASLGLGGGVLACDPVICTFDTSMCNPGGGGTGGLQ